MNETEKILELLSKKDLTTDEQSYLADAFNTNPDIKKYKAIYDLLNDMKNKFHLSSELISEYVLYKNNLPLEDKSVLKLVPHIEEHINQCSKCRKEFELFNEEYNSIDNFIDKTIVAKETVKNISGNEEKTPKVFSLFTTKYFYAAAALIAIFTFSIFTTSKLLVPSYKNVSELNEFNYSTSRGRVATNFHNGLKALQDDNFSEAIFELKSDIKTNPNDETIFYTNYMLGLVYLKKSESDLFGLFTTFNQRDLDSSIAYLKRTVTMNRSDAFQNITLNAYYYIGKDYMLKDDFINAKKYLQIVLNNGGGYSANAKELLEIINQKL
jgi:tetratricopeptide (TPR) repeat protein